MFCEELIEARCKHFGVCGGCRYQNIPYDAQLERKQEEVRHLFGDCNPIIGCEEAWQWRNKMEFSFSQNKAGDKFLGLMMRGQRGRVVTLEECFLTSAWFIDTLRSVYAWWTKSAVEAYFHPKDIGTLRTLTLRQGQQTMAILTVSGDFEERDAFVEACGADSIILRRQILKKGSPTRFEEETLKGEPFIFEEMGDLRFKIRPRSFFQPNTVQAEILYQKVIEMADLSGDETLLDLFCGTGTIGMFAAPHVKKVIGVEMEPQAVEDAKENIALNGIENMEVFVANIEKEPLPKGDVAILDPPRAGLSPKLVEAVAQQGFKKIVYVSCNPKSQARNCAQFEELGYQIESVQPLDQFPQTPHVENIALITPKML